MKNNKKILIIILAVLLTTGIFLVVWSKNSGKNNKGVDNHIEPNNSIKVDNITQTIDDKIFFPFIINNNIIGLTGNTYRFSKFNIDGSGKQILYDLDIVGAERIVYSPSSTQAIVFSNYPKRNIKLYDFENNRVSNLSDNIRNIYWSRIDENKIFYSYNNPENYEWQINTAKPDGSNWKNLYKTNSEYPFDFSISPLENSMVLYYYTPFVETTEGDKILTSSIIDLSNNNVVPINENHLIKSVNWAPDSSKFTFTDQDNKLFVYTLKDNIVTNINLKTLDYKITWLNNDQILLANTINIDDPNAPAYHDKIYIYNIKDNSYKFFSFENDLIDVSLLSIINNNIYYTNNNILYKADLP